MRYMSPRELIVQVLVLVLIPVLILVVTVVAVGEEVWKDYLQLRKMKKAPVTDRVISIISKEAAKAGVSLEEAMLNCVSHGWSGFKAEWLNKRGSAQKVRTESASHEAGEIDF